MVFSTLGNFFTVLLLLGYGFSGLTIKLPENPNPQPLKWWQEDVIYQVYPRSLMDSNGDGVGDLKGIESKLDYIADLGVGSVWLSPIYESPMKDFGYDISNFTAIEPQFGTMNDFRDLSNAMKERGLKLIMDFVPNHSSDLHVWFNQSVHREGKYSDFYVWRDPKGYDEQGNPIVPNNWMSGFGGSAWEWNDIRKQFYLHQFVAEQPDLNFENPEVLKEMLAAMNFWLQEGVDGKLLAACLHLRLQRGRNLLVLACNKPIKYANLPCRIAKAPFEFSRVVLNFVGFLTRFDTVPSMYEDQRFLDEPEDPNRPPTSIPTDHSYWLHIYTYDQPKTLDALAEFRQLIDIYDLSDGRDRCLMIEAYLSVDVLMKYYGTKEKPIAHFPFNFEFIKRVTSEFNGTDIAGVVDDWLSKMPEGNTANWLLGNHDQFRIGSRFTPEVIDAFNMLTLLLPGSAVTYYGEEIGMLNTEISWEDTVDPAGCNAGPDRYHLFSRDPERTPMQWNADKNAGFSTGNKTWLPVNSNYPELNVQLQNSTTGDSHLKVYKRLTSLRKTDAWRYGSLEAKAIEDGAAFGYSRIFKGHGFLYLANFDNRTVTINASQQYEGIPSTATVHTTSINFVPDTSVGSSVDTNSIVIGPSHALIVEF